MNYVELTQTLAESFNALADEVQSLIDHKTILEHKLRFAHEQVSPASDMAASMAIFHCSPLPLFHMMNTLALDPQQASET